MPTAATKPKVTKKSKKATKKFVIDCTRAVDNEIFDTAAFVSCFAVKFLLFPLLLVTLCLHVAIRVLFPKQCLLGEVSP